MVEKSANIQPFDYYFIIDLRVTMFTIPKAEIQIKFLSI